MGKHLPKPDESTSPQHSGMQLLKDCPVCQTNFQQSDVRIVDTYDNVHLLHVTCSSCTHAILSLFAVSQFGMSSVGMATDLSAKDAERILDSAPIHEDELLSFHALLEGRYGETNRIEDLFMTQHIQI